MRKLTDVQEQKIKKEYLNGLSINDLKKKYNLGEKTVRNALKRTGTIKRSKSDAFKLYYKSDEGKKKKLNHGNKIRKYNVNHNFFKLPLTPVSAYVLGFWLADGHIEKRNKNLISFSQMDSEILEKIKIALQATNKILSVKNRGYKLCISSKEISEDLKKIFNCKFIKINKSKTAKYPSIPKELDSHFIRGVFDGDGGIWKNKKGQLIFDITGTKSLNTKIQKKLIKNCNVNPIKLSIRGDFCHLTYCGNKQVKRILDWLYKESEIHLEKKKNIHNNL